MKRTWSLEERTDRLAARLYRFPPERDTYLWARLRMAIAQHDAVRAIRAEIIPSLVRLNAVMQQTQDSIEALGRAFRKR